MRSGEPKTSHSLRGVGASRSHYHWRIESCPWMNPRLAKPSGFKCVIALCTTVAPRESANVWGVRRNVRGGDECSHPIDEFSAPELPNVNSLSIQFRDSISA